MKRLTLKGTGKEPIVKELQARLDIQNFDFALSVHLAQELTQRDKKPSSASTSATTSATTSELDVNVTDLDLGINQIMHRCLYHSLYKPPGCGQHSIHLCLCEEDATHQSGSPTTVYSFFVSIGLNPSGAPVTENPQRLRISRSEPGAKESPSRATTRCCSHILSSGKMSTHSLSDDGPPTFQFIVHSDTPTPTSDTIENSILTLHRLTKLCSQGKRSFSLEEKDRYLLAVKLARWVFRYHNTPWPVPKLDTHHIHFFTQYETSPTLADWSPYISLSSPEGLSGPVEDVNCSNALGWMLVELGLGKSRDDIPGNTRRAINEASRSLMIRLGRRYSSFVKELLEFSGEGGKSCDSDVEKERIESLRKTVKCIEDKALKCFSG
ncbi:hypothetical protein L873DRAFT_1823539 [Choiromyces venosus 120613-1]|uniref:DUF7580 domain-containing protein n=1 Tax=Choiromyces venosus 120613-1 TaxID=1336337 RepID=A0A3N4ISC7_9PEZI|nr:hypothetical protein L873DRAFT_1823539 [Choiromyces venosus 120613-1]